MMVHKYIPSFIDDPQRDMELVNTLEEFMDIPWIKSHSEYEDFRRYSISPSDINHPYCTGYDFIVERLDGKTHYVIAYISVHFEDSSFLTDNFSLWDNK